MISPVSGPGPGHLQEIASFFIDKPMHTAQDDLPSQDLHVQAWNGREIFAFQGSDGPHGRLYRARKGERVAYAAALTPDGQEALFSVRRGSRHEILTAPVRLDAAGWLARQFTPPRCLAVAPDEVTDLDVAPDGAVAVAMHDQVRELRDGRLGPALQLPDHVVDVQYLADGSLAVCTGFPYDSPTRRYFWAPDGVTPMTEVPLSSISQEKYEKFLRQKFQGTFLEGRPVEELERFDGGGDWLRNDGQFKAHQAFENPANPDQAAVLVQQRKDLSLWSYRHSDGLARDLGTLHGEDPQACQGLWSPDGRALGLWDLHATPVIAEVFQFGGDQAGQRTTLVDVQGLQADPQAGAISFDVPGGRAQVSLTEAPQVATQPWYPEFEARHKSTLKGDLFDVRPGTTKGAGLAKGTGIQVGDSFVDIGGIRLPLNGVAHR